jgi:L-seryl-tRNA(Ser) seleniumtransferase
MTPSSTPDFRQLPSVHAVVESLGDTAARFPHALVVEEVRRAIDAAREALRAGGEMPDVAGAARNALESLERRSLRRVINATGVVLHTNLGRAPLGDGYCNLEYDLAAGGRGRRDAHVGGLLERLLGSPGIVVNNNAAAVYLALNELAGGGEAVVSRGELIEIGDGFRIPDIMAKSGAALREVGTTNRTSLADYRDAIGPNTRLLMIVHPSNFRVSGFTAKPSRGELAELSRESGIPLYEDLGSGCLADLAPHGIAEPRAQESLRDGVSLVSFSGDKLLGGPQAGILAGRADLVRRLRANPMFRALRLDKVILSILEDTLRASLLERWERIPALRMIRLGVAEIRARAQALAARIPGAEVVDGDSVTGGGSTPEQTLATALVAWRPADVVAAERALRGADPPVVARIEDGRLLVDLRTVDSSEEPDLLAAILFATGASSASPRTSPDRPA